MSAAIAPEVLDDPIAVIVDLVTHVEPSLDGALTAEVAAGITGGRAKRRRPKPCSTSRRC
jgi:hypothetical protein